MGGDSLVNDCGAFQPNYTHPLNCSLLSPGTSRIFPVPTGLLSQVRNGVLYPSCVVSKLTAVDREN